MYSKDPQEFCRKIKPIKLSVTKSPEELANEIGYSKIFDCGTKTYILE